MADNVDITPGAGEKVATKQATHGGDSTQIQVVEQAIITGSEGSYTVAPVLGGAGAVSGGVQRVTLASDDPAVAQLAAGTKGDVAHDAADSGNPVKVGAVAKSFGAAPGSVDAAGDRVNLIATREGLQFAIGGHPNVVTHRVNYTTAQTNAAILTPASGKRLVVTRIAVRSDVVMAQTPNVLIGFHASTTPTGAGALDGHPGLPGGGGFQSGDGSGVIGVGGVDDKLLITTGTISSGSLSVFVTYWEQ